jgi:hypothetical protein
VSAERRLARLADERTTLFARAGTVNGLSKDDHARLGAIERQIDDLAAAMADVVRLVT